jgi:dipeptidyl aminopeptidase/acylaminoacyl peptidase
MRRRALLLAAVLLVTVPVTPSHASGPVVLVSARLSGALSRVSVYGQIAVVEPLVTRDDGAHLTPFQASDGSVSYAVDARGDESDVGVLDLDTLAARQVTHDGHAVQLLVSPDHRWHYVVTRAGGGFDAHLDALVRTDARGRHRKTLFSLHDDEGSFTLSYAALSPDGRTLYLGTTESLGFTESVGAVWAVDTATGAHRQLSVGLLPGGIVSIAVSPDGQTLAVSWVEFLYQYKVALVPVSGGTPRQLDATGRGGIAASAFTPDGKRVILAIHDPYGIDDAGLAFGDVLTGEVLPIAGTKFLEWAVPLAP